MTPPVTFWLRRLVPIHLTVEYATPYDPCNDTGFGLDVTIEERLVEFLDNFRECLGGRQMSLSAEISSSFTPVGRWPTTCLVTLPAQ